MAASWSFWRLRLEFGGAVRILTAAEGREFWELNDVAVQVPAGAPALLHHTHGACGQRPKDGRARVDGNAKLQKVRHPDVQGPGTTAIRRFTRYLTGLQFRVSSIDVRVGTTLCHRLVTIV